MSKFVHRVPFAALLFVPVISLCGCASLSQPNSARFASVVIRGGTADQIRVETEKVFAGENWQAAPADEGEMVFEREGSQWDHIAYGSNVHDTPILNRAHVSIVPLADGSMRLQCQAYVVRGSGGLGADEEIKLYAPRAREYRELLDKVAAYFIAKSRE